MKLSIKDKARELRDKIPEHYRPATYTGTTVACVFIAAMAIGNIGDGHDNNAESDSISNPAENTEAVQNQSAPSYTTPRKIEFYAVSDEETCEKTAEAMRNYGDNITDPRFNGRTIYADCMQTGPDEYALILQNGPE